MLLVSYLLFLPVNLFTVWTEKILTLKIDITTYKRFIFPDSEPRTKKKKKKDRIVHLFPESFLFLGHNEGRGRRRQVEV